MKFQKKAKSCITGDGLKFHDGKPVTSKDVKFTFIIW